MLQRNLFPKKVFYFIYFISFLALYNDRLGSAKLPSYFVFIVILLWKNLRRDKIKERKTFWLSKKSFFSHGFRVKEIFNNNY
jgi:hypothetical protein